MYISQIILIYPYFLPSPLIIITLFSTSMRLLLFCKSGNLYWFLDSTYKQYCMIFLFMSGLLHLVWQSLDPHMLLQMMLFYSPLWLSSVPLRVCVCVCVCVCAELLQSCLILCNPMDCGPPGSSVHGILQARILEWVAMPSSRRSS